MTNALPAGRQAVGRQMTNKIQMTNVQ